MISEKVIRAIQADTEYNAALDAAGRANGRALEIKLEWRAAWNALSPEEAAALTAAMRGRQNG